MSDDVENDWTEVTGDCRSRRNRQVETRADHDEWPTELKSCRRVQDLEVLVEFHAAKIHQIQRDGVVNIVKFVTKIVTGWIKVGPVGKVENFVISTVTD